MAGSSDVESKLQALTPAEAQALAALLESNGIAPEELGRAANEVTHLEMFLQDYPRMLGLHMFTRLTSLQLIDQGITQIEGLEQCTQLEKLWLIENSIGAIQGVEQLTQLRELYLYSNRIRRIENLAALTNLEVLWLSDNYISRLEGLDTLGKLRELQLARNDIETVGSVLSWNSEITSLNLADNPITSFKELRALARLPKLVELSLGDPFWGDCPVTRLCNYQIYTLHIMPRLTAMDTLLLAEEAKQAASATFLKKEMYYNMRVKTLERQMKAVVEAARRGKQVQHDYWQALGGKLVEERNAVRRWVQEDGAYKSGRVTPDEAQAAERKLAALDDRLAQLTALELEVDASFDRCKADSYRLKDGHVARLMLELESGGNIRLEDGRPSDMWYQSCVELVTSRTNVDELLSLGVLGIQVRHVTRIHNRILKTKFERAVNPDADGGSSGTGGGDGGGLRGTAEFLLYGATSGSAAELHHVAQEGFRDVAPDGIVRLHSSVNLADASGLQFALAAIASAAAAAAMADGGGTQGADDGEAGVSGRGGGYGSSSSGGGRPASIVAELLVVKACFGRTCQETVGSGKQVSPEKYTGMTAVYRSKPSEPKQRTWHLFDPNLALPEYLVELEYQLQPSAPIASANGHNRKAYERSVESDAAAAAHSVPLELQPLCKPLLPWLELRPASSNGTTTALSTAQNGVSTAPYIPLQLNPQEQALEDSCRQTVVMLPRAPRRPNLYHITDELLLKHVSNQPLTNLTYLDLHASGLRKIEGLDSCRSLQRLVLTCNDIQRIEGLGELTALSHLELSYNRIRRIEGLKGLVSLARLALDHNYITRLDDLNALKKHLSQLAELSLSGNPLCLEKSYVTMVLRRLPALQLLDGQRVYSGVAAGQSIDIIGVLTAPMVKQCAHSRLDPSEPGWAASVESVCVDGQRLRHLQNLSGLSAMTRASFKDNELGRAEGLQQCTALQHLDLTDNCLTQIDALQSLKQLRHLDLGSNKLTSLAALSGLSQLTQLCIEDNLLDSLSGLAGLSNLMQLYAGGNQVAELSQVQHLRALPKLLILDLYSNPVCSVMDYRPFTIYNVRKLKVLDGRSIDSSELSAARNTYAGRLSREFLEQQLGYNRLYHIRELNLAGLRIRDVGTVFLTPDFETLQQLNLDNNQISDVAGLAKLSALTALSLNGNRLGEGDCSFSASRVASRLSEQRQTSGRETPGGGGGGGSSNGPGGGGPTGTSAAPSSAVAAAVATCINDDAGPLVVLPALQILQLGANGFSTIASLQLGALSNLRSLFLQGNDITRIDGLSGLTSLRELVLDNNRIRYIDSESLVGLPALRELRLEDNGLRSLCGLQPVAASLASLHVSGNRIVDLIEIDRLAALPALLEVTLTGNPLTRKHNYRQLLVNKCLRLQQADGGAVTSEERDAATQLFSVPGGMMGLEGGGSSTGGGYNGVHEGALETAYRQIEAQMAGMVIAAGAGSGNSKLMITPSSSAVAPAGGGGLSPGVRLGLGIGVGQNVPCKLSSLNAAIGYDMSGVGGSSGGIAGGGGGASSSYSAPLTVPSIQSNTVVLSGSSAFGLAGVGFRDYAYSTAADGSFNRTPSLKSGQTAKQSPVRGRPGALKEGGGSSGGGWSPGSRRQVLLSSPIRPTLNGPS